MADNQRSIADEKHHFKTFPNSYPLPAFHKGVRFIQNWQSAELS